MEPAGRMSTSAESAEPRRARRGRIAPVWFVLRWLLFLLATLWAFGAIVRMLGWRPAIVKGKGAEPHRRATQNRGFVDTFASAC